MTGHIAFGVSIFIFFFFGTAYLFAYTSGKGELVQEISKIKANLLIQLGKYFNVCLNANCFEIKYLQVF